MTYQWGLSFFGQNATNLFGIDNKYLTEVAYKEIFHLVGYGFSYEALQNMPIAKRRYYFHLWIEKKQAEAGETPQNKNKHKFDPVRKNE